MSDGLAWPPGVRPAKGCPSVFLEHLCNACCCVDEKCVLFVKAVGDAFPSGIPPVLRARMPATLLREGRCPCFFLTKFWSQHGPIDRKIVQSATASIPPSARFNYRLSSNITSAKFARIFPCIILDKRRLKNTCWLQICVCRTHWRQTSRCG